MSRRGITSGQPLDRFDHDLMSPVLLAQPVVHHAAAAFFVALALFAAAFCALPEFSRQETVRGEVVASRGFSVIASEVGGSITAVYKRLGDVVAAGDLIATIRVPRTVSHGRDTAQDSERDIQLALTSVEQQMNETEQRLAAINAGLPAVEVEAARSLDALRQQRVMSDQVLAIVAQRRRKIAPLEEKGFISQVTMDEIEAREIGARRESRGLDVQMAELQRSVVERRLSSAEEIRSTRLSLADLRQRWLQLRAQLQSARASDIIELRATDAGRLSAMQMRPNQHVAAGESLAAVSQPTAEARISLQVPSAAIGVIRPGQLVNIKYDAFPFATYGIAHGQIVSIEEASVKGGATPIAEGAPGASRTFGVDVRPDRTTVNVGGTPIPLKIGMELSAEITVERRSLFGWWLEPLLALRERAA